MSGLEVPDRKCAGYGHVLPGYWQDSTGGVHKCTYEEIKVEDSYVDLLEAREQIIDSPPQSSVDRTQAVEALEYVEEAIKVYEEGAGIYPKTTAGSVKETVSPFDIETHKKIVKDGTVTYIPIGQEVIATPKTGIGDTVGGIAKKNGNNAVVVIVAVCVLGLLVFLFGGQRR